MKTFTNKEAVCVYIALIIGGNFRNYKNFKNKDDIIFKLSKLAAELPTLDSIDTFISAEELAFVKNAIKSVKITNYVKGYVNGVLNYHCFY